MDITEKELILKLQGLKSIKPSQNWVALSKTKIFASSVTSPIVESTPFYKSTFSSLSRMFFQKKLAYALAVILFVFTGFFSFKGINSPAPIPQLRGDVSTNSDVQRLKVTSQNLVAAVNNKQKSEISVAVREFNEATKNLTEAIVKDPTLAKNVALDVKNNKTYLDISSEAGVKESSDNLYKTIDSQIIEDLEKTTLTQDQQKELDEAKELYTQGEYSQALEKILLIDANNKQGDSEDDRDAQDSNN